MFRYWGLHLWGYGIRTPDPLLAMNTTLKLDGVGDSPFVLPEGGGSDSLELRRESAANPVAISLSCPVESFRRCREKICVKRL
jgi:hypothetical protein